MLIITVAIQPQPELRAELVEQLLHLTQTTQTEPGCLRYDFFTPLADPDRIMLLEMWESEAALNQHIQTEHFQAFQQQMPRFLAAPPVFERYSAERLP